VRSEALLKLGRGIRSLRVERGYGQERFARQASLDRSYYGAIERGERNITYETLLKIARGPGSTHQRGRAAGRICEALIASRGALLSLEPLRQH
jgi:transcriptional regulator with XRE-family HTH domain